MNRHVFAALADAGASQCLRAALTVRRLELIQVHSVEDLLSSGSRAGGAALTWDLMPQDGPPPEVVSSLRARHPALPILLYVSLRPGMEAHITPCLAVPGVSWKVRFGDHDEPGRLGRFVDETLRTAPAALFADLIGRELRASPKRIAAFARAGIERLGGNGQPAGRATVNDVAVVIGTTPRTLERDALRARVLAPRDLLAWVTLLFVHHLAEWGNLRGSDVATQLGLDANAAYELRRRLLPPTLRSTRPYPPFARLLEEFRRQWTGDQRRMLASDDPPKPIRRSAVWALGRARDRRVRSPSPHRGDGERGEEPAGGVRPHRSAAVAPPARRGTLA